MDVNDRSLLPPSRLPTTTEPTWAMTRLEQQRITEWIGDAFAILCVRVAGLSVTERNLRLGFEAILRQLGIPPLRMLERANLPSYGRITASTTDLRQIIKALDSCLAIYTRYDAVLSTAQRRIQILVRATKRFAEEELGDRRGRQVVVSAPVPTEA